MSKNEYRRALIMLRPAMAGASGHARLERRTMTGSLYFIVSGQGDGWRAALAGQHGREYYAAALGELRRDDRGQLTLAYAFDPRNIGGRPLEAYQLAVVTRTDADGCQVALTGNIDGSFPMDPEAVREAVCALYQANEPAADLPAPEEVIPQPEPVAPEPEPELVPEPVPQPESDPEPHPLPEPEPEPAHTRIYTRMRAPEVVVIEPEPEPSPEPVNETSWCVQAAPSAMPLEDGYAYIKMPLPAACGMPYCLLGIRTEDNRVSSVRCALPGPYAPAPPRGLEGSVWIGAGDGGGYWVFTVACDTD